VRSRSGVLFTPACFPDGMRAGAVRGAGIALGVFGRARGVCGGAGIWPYERLVGRKLGMGGITEDEADEFVRGDHGREEAATEEEVIEERLRLRL
jgi:hypothetical protein